MVWNDNMIILGSTVRTDEFHNEDKSQKSNVSIKQKTEIVLIKLAYRNDRHKISFGLII